MTGPATSLFLACMGYFGAGKASTGPAMALSLIPAEGGVGRARIGRGRWTISHAAVREAPCLKGIVEEGALGWRRGRRRELGPRSIFVSLSILLGRG